jgi:rhodanese-related sulfurtransferase/rubrerythrin
LRRYIRDHHESEYLLVDVRQTGEYRNSHIPGARLMPLPQLVQNMSALPAQIDLIFYCHSGGRSAAAAAMVAEEAVSSANIYNLAGGIMAWQGGLVADFPKVQLFENQPFESMLKTAMNLEKGAMRFYNAVGGRYAAQAWSAIFARLAQAEIAHARSVHAILRQTAADHADFDHEFEHLSGEVLEGGMTLDLALQKLEGMQARACMRLVELALQIERAAFDLYRSLAEQVSEAPARDVFLSLAQAEKGHMQSLIDHVAACG